MRVVPSDKDFNPARDKLLVHFNWTRVAALVQYQTAKAWPDYPSNARYTHVRTNACLAHSLRLLPTTTHSRPSPPPRALRTDAYRCDLLLCSTCIFLISWVLYEYWIVLYRTSTNTIGITVAHNPWIACKEFARASRGRWAVLNFSLMNSAFSFSNNILDLHVFE